MRVLLEVNLPHQAFNAAVKDGSIGSKINRILQDAKPEAVYFTEIDGKRCGILIVDLEDASRIPTYCEPWFLTFEADIKIRPVMTPDDLMRAGLDSLGKKWS